MENDAKSGHEVVVELGAPMGRSVIGTSTNVVAFGEKIDFLRSKMPEQLSLAEKTEFTFFDRNSFLEYYTTEGIQPDIYTYNLLIDNAYSA